MTDTTTTISRDAIFEAVKERYRESLEHGWGCWHYVRVWPDGEITSGIEPSRMIPESEYFRREPHPVTIWSKVSNDHLDDDEIEAEMDAFGWDTFEEMVPDLDELLEPTGLTLVD